MPASTKQVAPVRRERDDSQKRLLAALNQPIVPVRAGLGYRVGLLLVALVMLILPLIYLALVLLVGYSIYWHATKEAGVLQASGSPRMKLLAYIMPIAFGGILMLFMIKPLFARRVPKTHPLSLSPAEQPTLFAFVARLCEMVRARQPSRIDVDTAVNASAGFGDGVLGFLRGELVLTIGLPLAAGLDLRQFTGVLAHELGHFAQGTAMRLSYLIRQTNMWFARVVYERDSWDQWLTDMSRDTPWVVALLVAIARLFVWLTRCILWLLMWVGHLISSFMMRQMEYDADRHEARVAGSETFVRTAEKLIALNVAAEAAFSDLLSAWQERRLCDNLPALICSREIEMPGEVRSAVTKHTRAMRTGWLHTHPSAADRIASARREATAGVFTVDAPASALFDNFNELCCRATVAFYHQQLEGIVKRENLVPTEALVADRGKKRENLQSLRRYFQELAHPIRPMFPERIVGRVINRDGAAEMLLDLRTQFFNAAVDARPAARAYNDADAVLISIARVRALKNACVKKIDPKEFELTTTDENELRALSAEQRAKRDAALASLNQVLTIGMQRLELALSLEAPAKAPESAAKVEHSGYDLQPESSAEDRLADAMRAIASNATLIETMRQQLNVLGVLLAVCQPETNPDELIQAVISISRKLAGTMSDIHSGLAITPYPYEHIEKKVTLAGYAMEYVPHHEVVGEVYSIADNALDALYSLYLRILSDMSRQAEQIERSLGLEPLPEPESAEAMPFPSALKSA